MLIYENKYVTLSYFENSSHIEIIWNSLSADMSDEEYRAIMGEMTAEIEKYRPVKNLVDTSEFVFTITPDLQEWTNSMIFPRHLAAGIRKAAFLVSKNIFSQVSVEQAMEEDEGSKFNTSYFETKESALDWLLSES